jgi:hypothetical protein
MAVIRTTTVEASEEGSAFAPAGGVVTFQVKAETLDVQFNVLARLHIDAPWAKIDTIDMSNPIASYNALPLMRVDVAGNVAGNAAHVWSAE